MIEYLELLRNGYIALLCGILIVTSVVLAAVVTISYAFVKTSQIRSDLILSLTKDGKSMREIENLLILHKSPYALDRLAMWTFDKVYSRYSCNTDDAIEAVKAMRVKT